MLMNRSMPLVLFLSAFLLLSPYSALAADSTSGCYGPTTVKLSPRTCDSASKNCNVPITVSAEHKPGMSLCLQGIDTTYELYPTNATAFAVFSDPTRTCRPLLPSQTTTNMGDNCFSGVRDPARSAISAAGPKQRGAYTVLTADKTLDICLSPSVNIGREQDCTNGLHTWMATCDTAECSNCMQVASYYCPEIKTYTIDSLQYGQFVYTFEMKTSQVSSDTPATVSKTIPTSASGGQPNPYDGWTLITNAPNSKARPKHVEDGNCNDYCAMMGTGIDFHTSNKCYKSSDDLCSPSRQVTWQEFDPAQDEGSVALPYTAQDDSMLTERLFTTYSIVNPFTYTIDIELDAAPADPEITAACGTTGAADVGVEAQQYPRPDLLYVRRVCDQVVLSLGHCVLRYSHRDDSAMYWTVENRGNSSECAVHVVDGTAARQVMLSVAPMAERRAGGSESSKKLPAWVIAVIVVVAVVVIAAVVIAVLCICPCTRGPLMGFFHCNNEFADAKRTASNPLQASALCDVAGKLEESEEASQNVSDSVRTTPPAPVLPANGRTNHQTQQVPVRLETPTGEQRLVPRQEAEREAAAATTTETVVGDDALGNSNEVHPASIHAVHVESLVYLIVQIGFSNRGDDERQRLFSEMRYSWRLLGSIIMPISHQVVPIVCVPGTRDAPMQSVMPHQLEHEFIRTVVRSTAQYMINSDGEAAIAEATHRIMQYVAEHGGDLVSCLAIMNEERDARIAAAYAKNRNNTTNDNINIRKKNNNNNNNNNTNNDTNNDNNTA